MREILGSEGILGDCVGEGRGHVWGEGNVVLYRSINNCEINFHSFVELSGLSSIVYDVLALLLLI